jgi:hypothetical protein
MWLINAHQLSLKEFRGSKQPPYAILSHTWEDGAELDFGDVAQQKTQGRSGRDKSY